MGDKWASADSSSTLITTAKKSGILAVLNVAFDFEAADYAAVRRAVYTALEKEDS